MAPNGTLHLHGKNAFHEIDHGTSTANYQLRSGIRLQWMKGWPDEAADVAGIRREFCRSLFHGASLWWFDMWGGYYESGRLVEEIGTFQKIHDRLADVRREPEAQIAVIVDPESALYVDDEAPETIAEEMMPLLLRACNRCGAPYRVFSFRDIPHIEQLDAYRLVLLPGLFELSEEKEKILRKWILKGDRTVVWLYGAALFDGRRKTPSRMRELTGFRQEESGAPERKMENWTSVFLPDSRSLTPGETAVPGGEGGGSFLYGSSLPGVGVARSADDSYGGERTADDPSAPPRRNPDAAGERRSERRTNPVRV